MPAICPLSDWQRWQHAMPGQLCISKPRCNGSARTGARADRVAIRDVASQGLCIQHALCALSG